MKKLLFLCCLLIAPIAQAAWLDTLYQADVPVTSESAAQRNKAIANALGTVLIKVSGQTDITSEPEIHAQLNKPASLVSNFSYHTLLQADDGKKQTMLTVSFEPQLINHILRQGQHALWGPTRPDILVWLVIADDQGKQLMGSESQSPAHLAFNQVAKERGLIFTFPILDLVDFQHISITDVWNNNLSKLQQFSKRYQTQTLLQANVQRLDDATWQANWTLVDADKTYQWLLNANSLSELINAVGGHIADTLAKRYAVLEDKMNSADVIEMTVSNIRRAQDYAILLNYLQHLTATLDVQVAAVKPNVVVYKIRTRGSKNALIQSLAMNPKLAPDGTSQVDTQTLYYQLL